MHICLTTADIITMELAGASTSDQPEFIASYIDTATDTPGSAAGELSDTTPVEVVSSPITDQRMVYRIDVANIDSAAVTVVVKFVGASTRTIIRHSLAAGESANILNIAGSSGFSDPMSARGDMIYRNAGNTTTRLPLGSAGMVLGSDGSDLLFIAAGTGDIAGPGSSTVGDVMIFGDTSGTSAISRGQNIDSDGRITGLSMMQLDPDGSSATPSEGSLAWNQTHKTLDIKTDIAGVTLQAGQEDHTRVYNVTGSTVGNAVPVYPAGTYTSYDGEELPDVGLADADASGATVKARAVVGLTTAAMPTANHGIVTSRGYVNDVDTTGTAVGEVWSQGTELWLSETPGELTSVRPLLPASQIRVGKVGILHATTGRIDVHVVDLSWVGSTQTSANANERTGFVLLSRKPVDSNGTALTVSADDSTMTLTISSVAGSFPFYSANNLFVKVGNQTATWTDTEGGHYFYYDQYGVLTHTTTFSESFVLGPDAFVAYLQWDATNNETILDEPIVELHGIQMDGATHISLHEILGSQVHSGLSLNSLITNGNGDLDTHAQFGVDSGSITDEDLLHDIDALASTAESRILYLNGVGADLRQASGELTGTYFPVLTDNAAGVGSTGRLVYNEWTGSAWQLTTVSVNDFVLCHTFAVGTAAGGVNVYHVIGQAIYGNASDARTGADTEMANLVTILPFKEIRPISSTIFQTGSYANKANSRVRPSTDGDYVDWRVDAVPGGSSISISSHNALSGRSDTACHPATAISVDAAAFSGNLSVTDTDVQTALDTIDAMSTGGGSGIDRHRLYLGI